MIGSLNLAGGGSSSGLNVYAQLAEPSKKNGIWIKTEETEVNENTTLPQISKYKYEKIEIRNNLLNNDYTELPIDNGNADISDFSGSLGTVLNNEIYLFGTSATSTGLSKISRKYNPSTNTYTQLAGAPISSSHNGSAITLNNTIYLFFYSMSIFYAYKYNIISDTYTKLNTPPGDLGKAISAVLINNKIYLIGETRIYEYDISTNSYILLSTIPVTYYRTNTSSL